VVPVSTVVDCQSNEEYKNIVNDAGMATPDGMPVAWYGRVRGNRAVSRTYGPDLMLDFCQKSQTKKYKHYFYGASPETSSKLKNRLTALFPSIDIVGSYSPPYTSSYQQEDKKIVDEINNAHPDVVWVGLGSPKQDYWMYHHRDKIDAPVMVGVGAAFDFIAQTKPQAPKWMQKVGLEWLFRLVSEPGRLWRRYLIGNTKFIGYLCRDYYRQIVSTFKVKQ